MFGFVLFVLLMSTCAGAAGAIVRLSLFSFFLSLTLRSHASGFFLIFFFPVLS